MIEEAGNRVAIMVVHDGIEARTQPFSFRPTRIELSIAQRINPRVERVRFIGLVGIPGQVGAVVGEEVEAVVIERLGRQRRGKVRRAGIFVKEISVFAKKTGRWGWERLFPVS